MESLAAQTLDKPVTTQEHVRFLKKYNEPIKVTTLREAGERAIAEYGSEGYGVINREGAGWLERTAQGKLDVRYTDGTIEKGLTIGETVAAYFVCRLDEIDTNFWEDYAEATTVAEGRKVEKRRSRQRRDLCRKVYGCTWTEYLA